MRHRGNDLALEVGKEVNDKPGVQRIRLQDLIKWYFIPEAHLGKNIFCMGGRDS